MKIGRRSFLAALASLVPFRRASEPKPLTLWLFPQGAGPGWGVTVMYGVRSLTNPGGRLEITMDQDAKLDWPAEIRVELRLRTGTVWREQQRPLTARAGQHVRISQRGQT